MRKSSIMPFVMTMGLINEPIISHTLGYTSPIYIPKKHTTQSYRSQQRDGAKRK